MSKMKETDALEHTDSHIRQSINSDSPIRCFVPIERIESLTADIQNYLSYLNTRYHITIHALDWATKSYLRKFLSFNTHDHPLCLYVKSNPHLMKKCNHCQRLTISFAKNKPIIFGTCYFGISEYVFSFPLDEERGEYAIICAGSYRGDPKTVQERIHHAVEKHSCLDENTMIKLLEKSHCDSPDFEELNLLIRPLINMMVLYVMLLKQSNSILKNNSQKSSVFYFRILEYLNENYRNDLVASTIARENHCSVSYLSHIFKLNNGLSLRSYLNNLRIQEASIYLIRTDMPITQIAYLMGFSDSNYFSTVFRRVKGCTPREYRKIHGNLSSDIE